MYSPLRELVGIPLFETLFESARDKVERLAKYCTKYGNNATQEEVQKMETMRAANAGVDIMTWLLAGLTGLFKEELDDILRLREVSLIFLIYVYIYIYIYIYINTLSFAV
jgi:hypothetical protein